MEPKSLPCSSLYNAEAEGSKQRERETGAFLLSCLLQSQIASVAFFFFTACNLTERHTHTRVSRVNML